MGTGIGVSAPGTGRAGTALPQAVAAQVPPAEVDGVWVFTPIRRDGREWGTAVLSRVDGDRRRIYTARYALTIKGKERGKFEASIEEVGSGPVEALDRLLQEAQRRIDDEQPPLSVPPEAWFARSLRPRPMARLAKDESAALLERFRRYLRDHRQPVTRQRDLVAQVVLLVRGPSFRRGDPEGPAGAGRERRRRHGLSHARRPGSERTGARPRFRRRVQALRADARRRPITSTSSASGAAGSSNSRTIAWSGCFPSLPTSTPFSTSGTGWRSTACAVSAASGSWHHCEEPAGLGLLVAFAAGLLSFLSPCVLPLVPSYVGFLTGMTLPEVTERRRVALLHALLFVAGFSLVFILLGASATALGRALNQYQVWMQRIGGVLIIAFGLVCLGVFRADFLMRERRVRLDDKPVGLPRLAAGGNGVRRGLDALHRTGAGWHSRSRSHLERSRTGNAAPGGLLGGSRRPLSARRAGPRELPGMVPAVQAIFALGHADQRGAAGIRGNSDGNR